MRAWISLLALFAASPCGAFNFESFFGRAPAEEVCAPDVVARVESLRKPWGPMAARCSKGRLVGIAMTVGPVDRKALELAVASAFEVGPADLTPDPRQSAFEPQLSQSYRGIPVEGALVFIIERSRWVGGFGLDARLRETRGWNLSTVPAVSSTTAAATVMKAWEPVFGGILKLKGAALKITDHGRTTPPVLVWEVSGSVPQEILGYHVPGPATVTCDVRADDGKATEDCAGKYRR